MRVDGRDWGKVLGVGRLGGRVIACKSHSVTTGAVVTTRESLLLTKPGLSNEHALVMYVWLPNDQTGDDESVLTVSWLRYYPRKGECSVL